MMKEKETLAPLFVAGGDDAEAELDEGTRGAWSGNEADFGKGGGVVLRWAPPFC